MTRKAPNKMFIFSITLKKRRVWLETQKPAWTGLRRTNGENRVIMKKWNLIGKNQHFRHLFMKTWNEEDPYGILFHIAVCPEEPCGIDFFKKSSENQNPKNPKTSRILYFGFKTNISGLSDHSPGQKSAPNKIKHVPGPKNALKNKFFFIFAKKNKNLPS